MELSLEDDLAIKQYLLGNLTEEKQQQLEERLLTDTEYFERLQLIEDELVDEYARGVLAPGEREKFDSHFLSTPERHQKLRFASALRRYVSAAARPGEQAQASHDVEVLSLRQLLNSLRGKNPRLGYSLAAALLVMILGVAGSIFTNLSLRSELEATRSHQMALQRELQMQLENAGRMARELERVRTPPPPPVIAPPDFRGSPPATLSLALTPGLLRGEETTKKLSLAPGVHVIRLELQLPADDYKTYKAALHNDEGAELFTLNMLRSISIDGTRVVPASFPAEIILRGDYYVQLSGITAAGVSEPLAKYFLRILKK